MTNGSFDALLPFDGNSPCLQTPSKGRFWCVLAEFGSSACVIEDRHTAAGPAFVIAVSQSGLSRLASSGFARRMPANLKNFGARYLAFLG